MIACKGNYSEPSASTKMIPTSTPTFVYQRKRQQCTEPNDQPISAFRSEEALITGAKRGFNVACVNDDCSSSKYNFELFSASLKITDVDDLGKCSSFNELMTEKVLDEISERDTWALVLKSKGLLDRVWNGFALDAGVTSESYCSKACKACESLESTEQMIIYDNCEGPFHMSCFRPRVTRIPVGKCLCSSCSMKKPKILNNKSISKVDRIGGSEEGELGSTGFMFRDTEPYMTSVLIGDRFQANVPEWSGPVKHYHRAVEVHPAGNLGSQLKSYMIQLFLECNPTKTQNLSFIGNWLQCREVIKGTGQQDVDGSVCGKWRRAPLFEMQSDDWECFCSVLWNPAYADCAVPQELETEEVMKQLKYAEMMRPKLAAAKRRILRRAKSNGS